MALKTIEHFFFYEFDWFPADSCRLRKWCGEKGDDIEVGNDDSGLGPIR